MATSEPSESTRALQTDFSGAARHYLGNRWLLLGVAGVALVAFAALNWSWLVAVGVASVLLSVLPCLVMCGLGLCAYRFLDSSGAPQARGQADAGPPRPS